MAGFKRKRKFQEGGLSVDWSSRRNVSGKHMLILKEQAELQVITY